MYHSYTRTTLKADGTRHVERCDITSEHVAVTIGGRGGRESFLELVNNWNRTGLAASEPGAPIYIFTAEVTSS